jgi:streptogramin lyase
LLLTEGLDASSVATAEDTIWLGGKTGVTGIDAETGSTRLRVPLLALLDSTTTSIDATNEAIWFAGTAESRLFRIAPSRGSYTTFPVCERPSGIAASAGAVWVACADGTVSRVNADGTVDNISIGTPVTGIVAAFNRVWTSPGESLG